jgi:cytochrome c biogenesis protein CcdA
VNLSLSYIRGLLASVNPCGFVLLPTYLMYFLGVSSTDDAQRAPMLRALKVGAAVSVGFMAVFVAIGAVSEFFTDWLLANAKYATALIGSAFVVLGAAMLFGFRLPIATPKLDAGGRDRTVASMFVYGIAFAVASLGCTLPLFIATLFGAGRVDGFGAGAANGLAYSLGMSTVVLSLTVTLAAANQGLMRLLRHGMQYVEMLAGAFVLISGLYLLWYFYWVDVRETSEPITDAVERLQNRLLNFFQANWQVVAVLAAMLVVSAALYSALRERRRFAE